MARTSRSLGIDFGTSNSAAAWMCDGAARLIELTPGRTTMPTTFFFDPDTRRTLMGDEANRALLDGTEGRFMRALKRVLGTPLMHEKRQILSERTTFVQVIARFLAHIKAQAEAGTGERFDRVLSGRPVVFHAAGDPREAQALADLRTCYREAGFADVDFLPEPEAAAIAAGAGQGSDHGVGLIVDIGGGTSDFSVFRVAGQGRVTILASHGIRIGGTDFDRAISLDRVMPLLGKGSDLRKAMGPGTSPVPNAIFNDLATWEKIPFLYTPQNRRLTAEMARLAVLPDALARLDRTLELELGHDIAFAVERGKIAANDGADHPAIGLEMLQAGLSAPLSPGDLDACLARFAEALAQAARQTVRDAGIDADQVGQVVYVGGSSLMGLVGRTMRTAFPKARHSVSEVFTAVTHGLAIAAAGR